MHLSIRGLQNLEVGVENHDESVLTPTPTETHVNWQEESLEELTPGVEGIGDLVSGIANWFKRATGSKLKDRVDGLLDDETIEMINKTIRNKEWRKLQKLNTSPIGGSSIAGRLALYGKMESKHYLDNIRASEQSLNTHLKTYLSAITKHSDAIQAIDKQAKIDWGHADSKEAKLEIVQKALAAIRELQDPADVYGQLPIEVVGSLFPYTHEGTSGWKRHKDIDYPEKIEPLSQQQFEEACDLFIEVYDEFSSSDAKFWNSIEVAAEYVDGRRGMPFWNQIRDATNEGKLWKNYALSCITSWNVERLLYDSVFAMHYWNSLRGLIALISKSVG